MNKDKLILPRTFDRMEVQDNYARVATFYDFWTLLTESKATQKAIELARIKTGEMILEVAVGTGVVFQKIVRRNRSGLSIGMDISEDMLAKGMKRLRKCNDRAFYFQIGNALHLPYKDNRFDLIINNYMFDLLPEETFTPILLEFKRVLKRSGRLVIVSMGYGTKKNNHFWVWLAEHFPGILTGCRPISINPFLEDAGLRSEKTVTVSQNTFPSEIVKAVPESGL